MSLKELKRLAPWQWESKTATKKHTIGPKGLQEWEQIQRAFLEANAGSEATGTFKAAGAAGCKRRRNKDAAASGVTSGAPIGTVTPGGIEPAKKHRLAGAPEDNHGLNQQQPPLEDMTEDDHTTLVAATTAEPQSSDDLHHYGLEGGSSRRVSRTTRSDAPAPADDKALPALAGGLNNTGSSSSIKEQQPSTAPKKPPHSSMVAHTHTPAAALKGVLSPAAALLFETFSPSPYVPTPVPYAGLKQRGGAAISAANAQHSHHKGPAGSSRLGNAAAAAVSGRAADGDSSSSRGGRSTFAAVTPVPRCQLMSTETMPPPANKGARSSSAANQQLHGHAATPAAAAAFKAAAAAAAPTPAPSTVLKRAPSGTHTPRLLQGLPSLSALLSASSSAGGPFSPDPSAAAAAAATPAARPGLCSRSSRGTMSTADAAAGHEHSSPLAAVLSTPGPQVVKALPGAAVAPQTATAAAAGQKKHPGGLGSTCCGSISNNSNNNSSPNNSSSQVDQQQGSFPSSSPGSSGQGTPSSSVIAAGDAGGGASSKARLPAKLRCKASKAAAAVAAVAADFGAVNSSSCAVLAATLGSDRPAAACVAENTSAQQQQPISPMEIDPVAAANSTATAALDLKNGQISPQQALLTAAAAAAAQIEAVSNAGSAAGCLNLQSSGQDNHTAEAAVAVTPQPAAVRTARDVGTDDQQARAQSPATLAMARSADLLLLAAAAEAGIAAAAEAEVAAGAAAAAAEEKEDEEEAAAQSGQQQQLSKEHVCPEQPAALEANTAATAGSGDAAPAPVAAGSSAATAAAANPNRAGRQPAKARRGVQQPRGAAATAAVAAAATARQHHHVELTQQRMHHVDSLLPAPNMPHVPVVASPAAAAAAAAAAAGTAAGVYAGGTPIMSNCSSSLMLPPAAQARLMQIQQQHSATAAAVVASGRTPHNSSMMIANAAVRTPHVQPGVAALMHPGSCRTAHLSQAVHLQHPSSSSHVTPRAVAAAATSPCPGGAFNIASGVSPLLSHMQPQQQQQRRRRSASPTGVLAAAAAAAPAQLPPPAGAAPAQLPPPALAAATTAVRSSGGCAGSRAAAEAMQSIAGSSSSCVGEVVLDIAPLQIPAPLSEAECWRLAQSQPWIIEAEVKAALQLLAAAQLAAAAPAAAAAAAKIQVEGRNGGGAAGQAAAQQGSQGNAGASCARQSGSGRQAGVLTARQPGGGGMRSVAATGLFSCSGLQGPGAAQPAAGYGAQKQQLQCGADRALRPINM